jgi:hypothetical protein
VHDRDDDFLTNRTRLAPHQPVVVALVTQRAVMGSLVSKPDGWPEEDARAVRTAVVPGSQIDAHILLACQHPGIGSQRGLKSAELLNGSSRLLVTLLIDSCLSQNVNGHLSTYLTALRRIFLAFLI